MTIRHGRPGHPTQLPSIPKGVRKANLMGTSYTNADVARWKRQEAAATGEVTKARNRLADKIVTVCIDTTVNQIIRPGPVAEERECYDMANELRAIKAQMVKLVAEVLRVSSEED